ncbi:TPA: heparinase II/III family protein [Photobacterium damselae]
MIGDWLVNNPVMQGDGWEPYPLSLRIVNWIKFFIANDIREKKLLDSLFVQVDALSLSLEYHLLGNHLFANAKALVFAGCFFSGSDADRWLKKGLSILCKEIPEQILSDGGNFELSPMYHNIILGDMLDLCNLAITYPNNIDVSTRSNWKITAKKMLYWMNVMSHSDGEVAFFNDSAIGIAPNSTRLSEYAACFELRDDSRIVKQSSDALNVIYLQDSGYIAIVSADSKLLIDVAKVGPDYIPGHAHADTLSFEMSIDGYRVFVNSGTSVYGLGEERLRQRKTETHNTVRVDGMDSSEVWSGFRVARRAYPSSPVITEREGHVSVECAHDGYMRLPGKVTHTRKWTVEQGNLLVCDRLTGTYNHAEAHYHLHPDVVVDEFKSGNALVLHLPCGFQYMVNAEGADIKVIDTTWHPEFGLAVANKKLVLNFKQNEVKFILKRA